MNTWSATRAVGMLLAALLAGCGYRSDGGTDTDGRSREGGAAAPTAGAAALGTPVSSLDDVVKPFQAAGWCTDAESADLSRLSTTLDEVHRDSRAVARDWANFVAAYTSCRYDTADGSSYSMRLFVFKPGSFGEVQKAWKARWPAVNRYVYFGNGYALYSGYDHPDLATTFGVKHLRCGEITQVGGRKFPADVAGCMFTDTR